MLWLHPKTAAPAVPAVPVQVALRRRLLTWTWSCWARWGACLQLQLCWCLLFSCSFCHCHRRHCCCWVPVAGCQLQAVEQPPSLSFCRSAASIVWAPAPHCLHILPGPAPAAPTHHCPLPPCLPACPPTRLPARPADPPQHCHPGDSRRGGSHRGHPARQRGGTGARWAWWGGQCCWAEAGQGTTHHGTARHGCLCSRCVIRCSSWLPAVDECAATGLPPHPHPHAGLCVGCRAGVGEAAAGGPCGGSSSSRRGRAAAAAGTAARTAQDCV